MHGNWTSTWPGLATAPVIATVKLAASFAVRLTGDDRFRNSVSVAEPEPIQLEPLAQRSAILPFDGTVLATLCDEDRVAVPPKEISNFLRNAVIARSVRLTVTARAACKTGGARLGLARPDHVEAEFGLPSHRCGEVKVPLLIR